MGIIDAFGSSGLEQAVIDAIYPIGIIVTFNRPENPGQIFGVGTWQAYGPGRVIIGMGNNGETNYTVGNAEGGLDAVSLTTAQLPAHNHTFTGGSHSHTVSAVGNTSAGTRLGTGTQNNALMTITTSSVQVTGTIGNTGNGDGHENRQRFKVAWRWVRVS